MRTLALVIALAGGLLATRSAGQDRPPVVFDAASVKQNTAAGAGSFVGRQPGGRFSAQNASLREIILFAYPIQALQLVGGAGWVDSDRWDITAKLATVPAPPAPGATDDTLLALRALLADRFKLALRQETRELPIYALVLARGDGRLGPGITPSTTDCPALFAARSRGAALPPGLPTDGSLCSVQGRVGSLRMGSLPLADFATALAGRVQRPVVDRTGLAGAWNLTLTYAAEPSQIPTGVLAPGALAPSPDQNGSSIFTAIQEELGLKLESTRGAVEVTVIDRAERAVE